jgi:hypothetical protein
MVIEAPKKKAAIIRSTSVVAFSLYQGGTSAPILKYVGVLYWCCKWRAHPARLPALFSLEKIQRRRDEYGRMSCKLHFVQLCGTIVEDRHLPFLGQVSSKALSLRWR